MYMHQQVIILPLLIILAQQYLLSLLYIFAQHYLLPLLCILAQPYILPLPIYLRSHIYCCWWSSSGPQLFRDPPGVHWGCSWIVKKLLNKFPCGPQFFHERSENLSGTGARIEASYNQPYMKPLTSAAQTYISRRFTQRLRYSLEQVNEKLQVLRDQAFKFSITRHTPRESVGLKRIAGPPGAPRTPQEEKTKNK